MLGALRALPLARRIPRAAVCCHEPTGGHHAHCHEPAECGTCVAVSPLGHRMHIGGARALLSTAASSRALMVACPLVLTLASSATSPPGDTMRIATSPPNATHALP